jgi:hypothetical protein
MEFEIVKSTGTYLEVKFSDTLKLIGKRHSSRYTGSSTWETFFYKYGELKKKGPFGSTYIEECWFIPKGNAINGVILRKQWATKAEIMDALNQLKTK